MTDYDNTLKGALFVNDSKKSPNHPDYKGTIETEDGTQYWVSAWIKQPRDPSKPKFLSLALTPKDAQGSTAQRSTPSDNSDFLAQNQAKIDKHKAASTTSGPRQPPADFDSFDDDIPF